ncbi:MAG: class I SAM-dependent methyltransferase [Bdellovibrionaceae bacterium]|nr:class I SAM-dependent methyltransferase [Pseudobdellovibrionaceae bacterium]
MLTDAYYFLREGLTKWTCPRKPRDRTYILDSEFCEQYSYSQNQSDFKIISDYIFQKTLPSLPTQGKVLDVACGPGYFLFQMAKEKSDVTFFGLDISPEMIKKAHDTIKKENLKSVQITTGDMTNLINFFEPQTFDLISWNFAGHYCQTDDEFASTVEGIHKLLKPHGTFFMVDLIRFKREHTRLWFSKKYDLPFGNKFYQEVQASYLASYTPNELKNLIKQSPFGNLNFEWTPLFPVVFVAHNIKAMEQAKFEVKLPLPQKFKYYVLKFLLNTFA